MSFARVWTGFDFQAMRGNIEHSGHVKNQVDPLQIVAAWRDTFPKTDLNGNFLGDSYPLCSDLQSGTVRPFLRLGAKYVLLGSKSGLPSSFDDINARPRMAPDEAGSELYSALCDAATSGSCQYPSEVTLSTNINCNGAECEVDTLSVVMMVQNDQVQYYKYVPAPCTTLAFYSNPQTIRKFKQYSTPAVEQCGNPLTASAGAVCCDSSDLFDGRDVDTCYYKWEKMTYNTMVARCASQSKVPCSAYSAGGITSMRSFCATDHPATHAHSCPEQAPTCVGHVSGTWGHCETIDGNPAPTCEYMITPDYAWTQDPCTLRVEVLPGGSIFIIQSESSPKVQIKVKWSSNHHPTAASCSSTAGCEEHSAGRCICNVTEATSAVFTDNTNVPSKEEIKARLHIGAVPYESLDTGVYTKCITAACTSQDEVEVYLKVSNGDEFDTSTIFKVPMRGKPTYLLNKVSTVFVGTDSTFSFRNPPSFFASAVATIPEAEYEMDAYLDHLLHHPNTAPFLCHFLIQRLVTSNPSPRYVRAVVNAFRSGTYDGTTYSGVYADLEATFHAILLDREARSTLLDSDPNYGQLREPLLKVVHSMKSLEYRKVNRQPVEFYDMQDKIGQEFNMQKSVFGFYRPDHMPDGPIGDADLHAPEEQLITGPNTIGFLNGMISLVQHGLSGANYGFGGNTYDTPSGGFTYSPTWEGSAALVNDLDLLLTGGRLSNTTHSVITTVVDAVIGPAGDEKIDGAKLNCTASSEYPHGNPEQWKCIKALQTGGIYGHWAMGSPWTSIDQWIEISFINGQAYEVTGFAWQNRPNKNIKDVTLEFSDGSTQQKTIEKWSSTEGCDSLDPAAALTCFQSLLPVTTTFVKFTVNSVYLPDADAFGAVKIELYTKSAPDSELLQAAQLAALKEAQILIMASSEFHTTNLAHLQAAMRPPPIEEVSFGRPYKAIIMILLNGGADTHNVVMPHSGCTGADLNAEYHTVRGDLAIDKTEMNTVTSQIANPCTTYGLHPSLPVLRDLYNDGDASIILNVGAMVEPMNKAQYHDGSKKKPLGLFGHFQMQKNAQSAHAQKAGAKGIGGRIMTALGKHAEPYKRSMYSTNGNMKATEGGHKAATIIDKYAEAGVVRFQSHDLYSSKIASVLSGQKAKSVFAETHAASVLDAMNSTQSLANILGDVTVTETFSTSSIGRQAKQVAKLIKARAELGAERDFFMLEDYGYDTHFDMKEGLVNKLADMNAALDSLVKEVKAEGIWDDVVILPVSDFSRTLTTNGAGTDHGWAGNTFVLGGQVRQQFLGTYPSLTEDSAHVLDRTGRLLPDLGWEAVYSPIAEWFGVNNEHMDEVLPNKANFDSDAIFRKEQLFELTPSPSSTPSSSPSAESTSAPSSSPSAESTSAPSSSPSVGPSSSNGFATGCDDVRDTYRDNNCCGQPADQSVDTSITFPAGNTVVNPTCSELKGLYEHQSCCSSPMITGTVWCNATNCTNIGS